MSQGTPVISCENIHKTYLLGVEGVAALRGISVDVYRGEPLVIYGTSAGGKSTLLNVLGTIDTPTKGNLAVLNSRITDQTEDSLMARLRCKKVGFVFQSFNLLGNMTAEENVALPMIIAGDLTGSEITERAHAFLTEVGLAHRMQSLASQLSGGEQQRVTIARAMANSPEVLLMDEPTGDLDTKNTEMVMNILLSLNRSRQLTMVMVTHDVYMKQYANRVLYLRDGRVHKIEAVAAEVRDRASSELQARVQHVASTHAPSTGHTLKRSTRRRADYPFNTEGKTVQPAQSDRLAMCRRLFPPKGTPHLQEYQPPVLGEALSTYSLASLMAADGVKPPPPAITLRRKSQSSPTVSAAVNVALQKRGFTFDDI